MSALNSTNAIAKAQPRTIIPTITEAGLIASTNAANTGIEIAITHIAFGLAKYKASGVEKALQDEIMRVAIAGGGKVSPTQIQVHAEAIAPTGSPFWCGEVGFFADEILFAVYSKPDAPTLYFADDSVTTVSYTLGFFALPADTVTVLIDPNINTAIQLIGAHETANDPHPQYRRLATETRTGVLEIATQAETDAGTDDERAITAKKLAQCLTRFAPLDSPALSGTPTTPTPANGDNSLKIANTAFVQKAITQVVIGQIVIEARTSARAGYLKLNGALLNRADYPDLWTYAQASGALIAEATWANGNWGCFSTGDGASNFRIPELRGEMLRCWDDGRGVDAARGIGTWQDSQNRLHGHTASAGAVGDHIHTGWTDAQGWHGHHGGTTWAGDHAHSVNSSPGIGQGAPGGNSVQSSGGSMATGVAGGHSHTFDTDGAGNHQHNIGVGGAGNHTHTITVNLDGGNEARPRNLAMLAMIRAYPV
ncbi:phage tail protein [Collimonas sp. H4R21]|uniref:Phage tail protein n=1 Tax=Collimonas rhizosphaerae TaxID=3126357 RepID=A0ABU9PQH1_9BURK